MKNQIILAASKLGFFKAKKSEKKEAIIYELLASFPKSPDFISDILNQEIEKRKLKSEKKANNRLLAELEKPISNGYTEKTIDNIEGNIFVVSAVQNNTDLNNDFYAALMRYVEYKKAKIILGEILYNKNAFAQPDDISSESVYFDPRISKFIIRDNIMLSNNLMFIGKAHILPTVQYPLNGFNSVSPCGVDCIIPASKIALKCTASLKNSDAGKILYSTGTLTAMNYIQRRIGVSAESLHNFGALVIEINEGIHSVRQLEFINGCFIDEGIAFYPDRIEHNIPASTLQFGDIHAEKMDKFNLNHANDLIARFKPDNLILHDLCDFSSRNHHNIKDPLFIYNNDKAKQSIIGDLNKVISVLNNFQYDGNIIVIESNHDLALLKYLKEIKDFRLDPINAEFYLWAMLACYQNAYDANFNILEYCLKFNNGTVKDIFDNGLQYIRDDVVFHKTDDSVMIAGVEHGNHGHHGTNGSRGSPKGLASLGIALNSGHTHTPEIVGKVYVGGVLASLDLGYNTGASSWRIASVVTWPNGGRQIIFK
jgi:hypothetical protein